LEPLRGRPVVVVDNGASAEVEQIAAAAGARYEATPRNLGFAGGVNVGLQLVGPARDVLLLNPDACLDWADVLRLQQALRSDPTLAAVAPALAGADGAPQRTVWPVPTPVSVWADALGVERVVRGPTFLSGAVLLLRAEAVAEVGGFDEQFFLYAEETDWQQRALRADWRVRVVPDVVAVHVGGATSASEDERVRRSTRSALAYARKWYPGAGAHVMRAGSVVAAARRAATSDASVRHEQAVRLRALVSG
jgi:GT2 family glycosyltransferase